MGFTDRYASAVRSSCLTVDERTRMSDTDVLGAAGLAAKSRSLEIALMRLYSGDNGKQAAVVEMLALMTYRAAPRFKAQVSRADAELVAQACLAWHRDGTCKHCGGHGVKRTPGTNRLGTRECEQCRGTGRMMLEQQFSVEPAKQLARWLVSEIEQTLGQAAQVASWRLGDRERV